MMQQVEELTSRALSELEPLAEPEALEKWRVWYLGRKGSLTQLLRGVSSLPVEERREAGSAANRAKNRLEGALSDKEEALKQDELSKRLGEAIDVTLPGHPVELGRLHPTTPDAPGDMPGLQQHGVPGGRGAGGRVGLL